MTDARRRGEPDFASEIVPEIEADAAVLTGVVDEFVGAVAGVCCARDPTDQARSTRARNNNLGFI